MGAIIYINGFKELFTKLPANYYNPIGVGIPLILVWIGTWVVNSVVAQVELQMLLTCKDEGIGKKGVYLSMIPLAFMTIMAPLVGLGLRLISLSKPWSSDPSPFDKRTICRCGFLSLLCWVFGHLPWYGEPPVSFRVL